MQNKKIKQFIKLNLFYGGLFNNVILILIFNIIVIVMSYDILLVKFIELKL